MEKYRLNDIFWAYNRKNKVVIPFIFNASNTKIKSLEDDSILKLAWIDLPEIERAAVALSDAYDLKTINTEVKSFADLYRADLISAKGLKGILPFELRFNLENVFNTVDVLEWKTAGINVDATKVKKLTDEIRKNLQHSTSKKTTKSKSTNTDEVVIDF